MNSLKNRIWTKIIAFIIIIISTSAVVFSTIGIVINHNYNWYNKAHENVNKDIITTVSDDVSFKINDYICSYYDYEFNYIDQNINIDEVIYSNEKQYSDFGYKIVFDKDTKAGFITEKGISKSKSVNIDMARQNNVYKNIYNHDFMKVTVYLGDIKPDTVPIDIYNKYYIYNAIYKYRNSFIAISIVSIILIILLFIYLMYYTGKNKPLNSIVLKKIPVDVTIVFGIIIISLMLVITSDLIYSTHIIMKCIMILINTIVITSIVTMICMLISIKLRNRLLINSSLIYIILKKVYGLLKYILNQFKLVLIKIPFVWKTAVITCGWLLINTLILGIAIVNQGAGILLWVISTIISFGVSIYIAFGFKQIREGAAFIAKGDLNYKIDKKYLHMEMAEHADDINRIRDGLSKAVDERIKSEHFKSELITNVSHDIKTPLTSIINYVDLIGKEELENKKVREYINVLQRQSERLKKLLEDLVEASKASTGAINLQMTECHINILLHQVIGEYKEKIDEAGLIIINNISEENVNVIADGKYMWRVMDNLMSNICKYSHQDTRVYITLDEFDGEAVITFKNTSRYELNISEEELMERFIRGDKSRNTEGSGLGLSIAKNLIQLQNGKMDIVIDGDLFKVIIKMKTA